jgi:hypothetical protein
MRLLRVSKKNRRTKTLGNQAELDIAWASGPGFRDGPEDYFSINAEANDHNYALEFSIDESRRIKEQLDKFLQYIDDETQWWEPGNYFKKLKEKKKRGDNA